MLLKHTVIEAFLYFSYCQVCTASVDSVDDAVQKELMSLSNLDKVQPTGERSWTNLWYGEKCLDIISLSRLLRATRSRYWVTKGDKVPEVFFWMFEKRRRGAFCIDFSKRIFRMMLRKNQLEISNAKTDSQKYLLTYGWFKKSWTSWDS